MWITDRPEHDAAMYDIERRREAEDYDIADYPVCDICGEHIVPDEEYFEHEQCYYHRDCVTWGLMK